MDYRFFGPQEIRFGWGARREVGTLAAKLGKRVWIVLGSRTLQNSPQFAEIQTALAAADLPSQLLAVISHEPEVADVDRATAELLERGLEPHDLVLAIGGGSALDFGKAVAAMATNRAGDSVADYLEGVGRGLQITAAPLPLLAMPTTAGTGAEATKNAVISSYDPAYKKSLRSDLMMPKIALVDPELTVSVPKTVTAYSGMDALTQCIESYVSCRAQPIPRALALQGAREAFRSLEMAVHVPDSQPAREGMAHAALLSGLALANSGLGLAHGVAAALGVHCRVPHGLACAVLLPVALRVNRDVSQTAIVELARETGLIDLTQPDRGIVHDFIDHIEAIAEGIGIPKRLSDLNVTREQIPGIARSSFGNSMSGNPREVSEHELITLLENLL